MKYFHISLTGIQTRYYFENLIFRETESFTMFHFYDLHFIICGKMICYVGILINFRFVKNVQIFFPNIVKVFHARLFLSIP